MPLNALATAPALSPLPRNAAQAFARYESIRPRLPQAEFGAEPVICESLSDVAERWEGFILDAYGVLNVGATPIPGAVERMAELRAMGKKLCVLTNGSSAPRRIALAKYRRLGFDFTEDEVVSSREVAAAALERIAPGALWGAISAEGDDFSDLPARVHDLCHGGWEKVDAILFLGSQRFDAGMRAALHRAMADRPRPIAIANPDLVAPFEQALSIEPGFWGHELLDQHDVPNHWFGKPFAEGFEAAVARTGLARHQLAMVGDTLHTDILGGRAAGLGTVLIKGHGLFAGHDPAPFIARSGIRPDVICRTT